MPRLIYTPDSLRDIVRLHAFLHHRDPETAGRAIRRIRESLHRLAARPEIGRPAPGMAPKFREWPIRFGQAGYVALYRHDASTVVVLAIRHFREAGY